MRIVKLPDGRLRIPVAAAGEGWAADGTEIIGADDPRYPDYLPLALTEDEHAGRDRENAVTNADLLARWGPDTKPSTATGPRDRRSSDGCAAWWT